MASRRAGVATAALAILVAAAALALPGCGGAETLSEEETKRVLLEDLPYRFEFWPVEVPEDADGALAGRVFGPHETVLRFGISLGAGGDAVPLGPRWDGEATGGETFRVSSNMMERVDGRLETGRSLETDAQWRTSATMVVDIETALCEETEGEPCAI